MEADSKMQRRTRVLPVVVISPAGGKQTRFTATGMSLRGTAVVFPHPAAIGGKGCRIQSFRTECSMTCGRSTISADLGSSHADGLESEKNVIEQCGWALWPPGISDAPAECLLPVKPSSRSMPGIMQRSCEWASQQQELHRVRRSGLSAVKILTAIAAAAAAAAACYDSEPCIGSHAARVVLLCICAAGATAAAAADASCS